MITNAQIKAIILQNLDDIRISSISLFLLKLISRKQFGGGINQYRLKNLNTGNYITSIEEFKVALDALMLTPDYNYNIRPNVGELIHPFTVTIDNVAIELDKNSYEDEVYLSLFSADVQKLVFHLNYMNDGDTILPLKIIEVRLF